MATQASATTPTSPVPLSHSQIGRQPSLRANSRPNTPSNSSNSASPGGILEAPAGVPYVEFVRQWQDAHIARWLSDNRCGHHIQAFRENDIRGDIILELDGETLKEIGVASVGDRTRIRNALKELRQLCARNSGPKLVVHNSPAESKGSKQLQLKLNGDASPPQKDAEILSPSTTRAGRRLDVGRPPPLQIDSSRAQNLPHIARGAAGNPPDSARSAATPRPHMQQHQTITRVQPAMPPAPRAPPPAPPGSRSTPRLNVPSGGAISRSRTPTTAESPQPPPFTNDPLPPAPMPISPWAGDYGLPRGPSPGNLSGGAFAGRVTSPLPPNSANRGRLPNPANQTHQKQPSSGSAGKSTRPPPAPPAHPYSTATSTLPSLHPPSLSPVAEAFTPSSASPPTAIPAGGFIVGRGPFRTNTGGSQTSAGGLTAEDFRKRTLKFYLKDVGSRMIEVKDGDGGFEILERALKKFNIKVQENEIESTNEGLTIDSWGVFVNSSGDGNPFTESQIMAVHCSDPDDPIRDSLHLQRASQYRRDELETSRSAKRASTTSIMNLLEVPGTSPPTSPGGTQRSGGSMFKLRNFFGHRPPSDLITNHLQEYFPFADKKVLNRTARNSIMRQNTKRQTMSQGGWVAPVRTTSRFSTSTMGSGRTADPKSPRQSSEQVEQGPPLSLPRMSVESEDGRIVDLTIMPEIKTVNEYGVRQPTELLTLPPVTIGDDSWSDNISKSLKLDRATSRASRRVSKITELKPTKEVPEAAKTMITVDHITSGIEASRRASYAASLRGSIGPGRTPAEAVAAVRKRESIAPTEVPVDEEEADDDDDDDEEDEEVTDEEEDEVEEDEETLAGEDVPAEKVTSKAATRSIKWIRGALIGSGSFGNVYLGMDSQRGLLMAVKQVELRGSSYSEERKASMLSALEREIELLKTLQHENIVQYLDSSIDDNNLNIFLEYVPGGSVSSLLRNYGAFEESLTANWVSQILRGLEYLHGQTIIHRDIKGANILVDNKGGIKISDFGISKKVEEGFSRMNRPSLQGSVFWMAPEVVKQTAYTSKADIWSVGCLIIEMLTGTHPFPEFNQMQAIWQIGSGTAKPKIPPDVTPAGTLFLQKAFEIDHNSRPSATELLTYEWLSPK